MTLKFVERLQKLQDLIEENDATWFMGTAALVALVSLWGL